MDWFSGFRGKWVNAVRGVFGGHFFFHGLLGSWTRFFFLCRHRKKRKGHLFSIMLTWVLYGLPSHPSPGNGSAVDSPTSSRLRDILRQKLPGLLSTPGSWSTASASRGQQNPLFFYFWWMDRTLCHPSETYPWSAITLFSAHQCEVFKKKRVLAMF